MSNKIALDALNDLLNGWRYIRSTHGELYGVGWDRADAKAVAAIAALQVSTAREVQPEKGESLGNSIAPAAGNLVTAMEEAIASIDAGMHRGASDTLGEALWKNRAAIAALQAEPQPEPVAQIVGTGGTANMPLLQWLSADHSFRAPIGSMLYALPATPPKD